MNKEFAPYEQALTLKELGFDEPCFAFYTPEKQLIIARGDILQSSVENAPSAPLYQQAFRWFREKYSLDSSIALVADGYGFYIHKNRNYTNKGENYGMHITPEEAELECLKKLIEIVKSK